jgi:hypothetical protein
VLFFQFFATMPKFKGRKTNRGVWDSESMRKAVDKVLSGELKIRTAADRSRPKKKPSTLNFGNSVKSGTKKLVKKKPKFSKPATSTTCVRSDDTQCIVCMENFDENWIQCCACLQWVHEECADIPNHYGFL